MSLTGRRRHAADGALASTFGDETGRIEEFFAASGVLVTPLAYRCSYFPLPVSNLSGATMRDPRFWSGEAVRPWRRW